MKKRPPIQGAHRADRLRGKKIVVGGHSVSVSKKIGEGGSAFIYLAKTDAFSAPPAVAPTMVSPPPPPSPSTSSLPSIEIVSSSSSSCASLSSWVEVPDGKNIKGANTSSSSPTKDRKWTSVGQSPSRRDLLKRSLSPGPSRRDLLKRSRSPHRTGSDKPRHIVLKATSVETPHMHRQAEVEVSMLRRLSSHPNILKFLESGYSSPDGSHNDDDEGKPRVHYLLVEHCNGGSLMDLIMKQKGDMADGMSPKLGLIQRLTGGKLRRRSLGEQSSSEKEKCDEHSDRSRYLRIETILRIFRQTADAVAFMHNRYGETEGGGLGEVAKEASEKIVGKKQHTPIVHRDLKPENILLINSEHSEEDEPDQEWQVKLCDFGSAIVGKVPLRSLAERDTASRMIRTSTTQMYRAPECIDLHMAEELTELTDVWSLGCCLYTMCFLQDCFERNSSLAILSGKYTIPDQHPYDDEIVELISRMLTIDPAQRPDINEVVSYVEALQEGFPLPPRLPATEGASTNSDRPVCVPRVIKSKAPRVQTPDRQKQSKPLCPNSAAARRREKCAVAPSKSVETDFSHSTTLGSPSFEGPPTGISNDAVEPRTPLYGGMSSFSDPFANAFASLTPARLRRVVSLDDRGKAVGPQNASPSQRCGSKDDALPLQRCVSLPARHLTASIKPQFSVDLFEASGTGDMGFEVTESSPNSWVAFDVTETFQPQVSGEFELHTPTGGIDVPSTASTSFSASESSHTSTEDAGNDNPLSKDTERQDGEGMLRLSISWDRFSRGTNASDTTDDVGQSLLRKSDMEVADYFRSICPSIFKF